MQLNFTVGDVEKHRVIFRFSKFWGHLSITVDEKIVRRDFRAFSTKLTKSYELTVGSEEPHSVRIDLTRTLILGGARPQAARAYVDGNLVAATEA